MGLRVFPETSVINYHYSLRNNLAERSSVVVLLNFENGNQNLEFT